MVIMSRAAHHQGGTTQALIFGFQVRSVEDAAKVEAAAVAFHDEDTYLLIEDGPLRAARFNMLRPLC